MPNPEKKLTSTFMDILKVNGIWCRRRNVAGCRPFPDRNGRVRWVNLGRPGESDITGTVPPWGTRLELEVKMPGNLPTPEQWDFLREQEALGAVAFWCDDEEWLKSACRHIRRGYKTRIAADGQIDFYRPDDRR